MAQNSLGTPAADVHISTAFNLGGFLVLTATEDEMKTINLPGNILDQPMGPLSFADLSVITMLRFRYADDVVDKSCFGNEFVLQNRAMLSPELQLVFLKAQEASLMGNIAFQVQDILFPSTPASAL